MWRLKLSLACCVQLHLFKHAECLLRRIKTLVVFSLRATLGTHRDFQVFLSPIWLSDRSRWVKQRFFLTYENISYIQRYTSATRRHRDNRAKRHVGLRMERTV